MKCSLCQTISNRLNELDDLHGEEFVKQWEESYTFWPSTREPYPKKVNREEFEVNKKVQYEAGWLDAIEEITNMFARFKITEQTLNTLESESVFLGSRYFTPEMQNNNILQQLPSLLNKEVLGEANFIDMLKKTIGDKKTTMFKKIILKYSRILEDNADVTQ